MLIALLTDNFYPQAAIALDFVLCCGGFFVSKLAQLLVLLPWQCKCMNLRAAASERALRGGVYLFGC